MGAGGRTGRAAVLTEYNGELELQDLPLPDVEPGALLVRVDCSTICGTDVHVWEGLLAGVMPVELLLILGHEIVGTVDTIGAGAERDSVGELLAPGDRVVWAPEPCGHCFFCTVEREPALCPTRRVGMLEGTRRHPYLAGGFAEYSYVFPRSGRLKVPDAVKSEWAAAASCALRTVVNAVERIGLIDYRHTVVIQGAGPLGLFGTALAAAHSPARLIVIGGPADRLEVARAWGATDVIAVETHNSDERIGLVRELTGGGADVLLELSGARGAFSEGVQMAARNARYAVVGPVGGTPQEVPVHLITHRGLTVVGSFSGDIDSYYKALRFMERERGSFDWDRMFSRRYTLDDVTTALRRMKTFDEIKPIVVPG